MSNSVVTLPETGVLAGFDLDSRTRLLEAGTVHDFPERTYFAKQGEPQDAMGIVISGKFSVSCQARGDILQLAELGEGEVIGEMSLIDPQNASANVRATDGAAKVWVLTAAEFDGFVEDAPKAGFRLLKAIASRLCKRIRKNSDVMLSKSEEDRNRFLDLDY